MIDGDGGESAEVSPVTMTPVDGWREGIEKAQLPSKCPHTILDTNSQTNSDSEGQTLPPPVREAMLCPTDIFSLYRSAQQAPIGRARYIPPKQEVHE